MRRGQRGLSPSVEAAILLPALVLFIGLLITLARVAIAQQQVESAASAAARAASLERGPAVAHAEALEAARRMLAEAGSSCRDPSIAVDAPGVGGALGERGVVTVTISCTVPLADVALPMIPGSIEISTERASPVDPLRGR